MPENIYHPNQYYKESRNAYKQQFITPPDSQKVDEIDMKEDTENVNDVTFTTEANTTLGEDDYDKILSEIDFEMDIIKPLTPPPNSDDVQEMQINDN